MKQTKKQSTFYVSHPTIPSHLIKKFDVFHKHLILECWSATTDPLIEMFKNVPRITIKWVDEKENVNDTLTFHECTVKDYEMTADWEKSEPMVVRIKYIYESISAQDY